MAHAAEMRRCLLDCDVAQARKLWAHVAPNMPQPESDEKTLAAIHMARTQMDSMPFKARAYSHRWLCDRGLPSQLPDLLKPKAERIHPVIVDAVAISVTPSASTLRPASLLIRRAMEDVVMDCYANGDKEPSFVKARMMEARSKAKTMLRDMIEDAMRESARQR